MYFDPTIPEDFDADPPTGIREGDYRTDDWGCLFYCAYSGLGGHPVDSEAPIADWKALDSYQPPDALDYRDRDKRDWDGIKIDFEDKKKRGILTRGDGGQLFTRLYWLRGFENLMMDIATNDPHLPQLIDMLTDYEMRLVNRWLKIGVDIVGFHTDIGTQTSLMISPGQFRQYIKPMFTTLFAPIRAAGSHVYLGSDGRLIEIVDDLIECGVSIHDPQLRANGLEDIAHAYKGRICINLDLDRQMFPFCKPQDIMDQVAASVETLSAPEGGLMLLAAVYGDDVPLANIEAICQALEKYCFD